MTRPTELCQIAGVYQGVIDGQRIIEEKINGWRHLWFRERQWTRNGMPLLGAGHLALIFRLMEDAAQRPLFLDGEFQVDGTLEATALHCQRGWRQGDRGRIVLFDCLPLDEWDANRSDTPLWERKAWLVSLVAKVKANPLSWEYRGNLDIDLTVAPDTWTDDAGFIADEAKRVWSGGGEGLMIKDPYAPYRRNKSGAWLKLKQNEGKTS